MKTLTLTNNFHHTSAAVRLGPDGRLSARTVRRVRRELCGVSGCTCAQGPLGDRGEGQDYTQVEEQIDGGVVVYLPEDFA